MTAQQSNLGSTPLILIKGDIDHASCGAVGKVLDETMSLGGNVILIDLADVSYIDSGGLSLLFTAGRQIRNSGWIGLIAPNASVHRLLELVGVLADPAFRIFEDRNEAESALVEGSPP